MILIKVHVLISYTVSLVITLQYTEHYIAHPKSADIYSSMCSQIKDCTCSSFSTKVSLSFILLIHFSHKVDQIWLCHKHHVYNLVFAVIFHVHCICYGEGYLILF